jgi:MinD-like ATPase involved in chromosome partitioning or flagellar assembly
MAPPRGRITTFYSYKGGTGRSMALANFAWIMAACGKHVLAIDWDLEAPGLHRYLRPFLSDPELFETDGLIDTFWVLAASALGKASSGANQTASRSEVVEAFEDATRRVDWKFPSGGYIDFIGAGRQGGTYSERVNSFDWKRFYELGGADLLTTEKNHLSARYDWVLIDSRTGVSDTSGVCTIQMPDSIVACFTLNRQSIDGVTAILQSIRAFHSASVDGSKIEFFPVATRIENAEQARLEVARGYARSALAEFVPRKWQLGLRDYWDKMEIAYRPAYAFEEILAAFGDATGATGAADTMLSQVETMAQCITDDQTLRFPEILEADRTRVLEKYALGRKRISLGTPSSAIGAVITGADDSLDATFLRNISSKEQLWRGSKFRWRFLLSRRELDLLTGEDRKGLGRNMQFYLVESERMRKFLARVRVLRLLPLVAPIVLSLALLFFNAWRFERPLYTYYFVREMLPLMVVEALAIWAIVLVLPNLFDKPYGLRAADIFLLSSGLGFSAEIRDYDPQEGPPHFKVDRR